jgi:Arc/MetJ-type ribon-helix-helix transcriptional regulator
MSETVRVRLPHPIVQAMDRLVKAGEFADRSDVVRTALRSLGGTP